MMTYNVLTLFPDTFKSVCDSSIWARAIKAGLIEVNPIDIRQYTHDKHRRADDYPSGGGSGMVMMPEPVHECFKDIEGRCQNPHINIYMSPRGKELDQRIVTELSAYPCVNILCGHYEGIDERVLDLHIDMEISIGDYVLTGGELASMVLIDACIRHVDGVLGNSESVKTESFSDGLIEYPQYTKPPVFEGISVPEILLSGNHAKVAAYNRRASIEETAKRRPDLLSTAVFTKSDIEYITGVKPETYKKKRIVNPESK
jgi:tRNA (guanine37-N1)-methyltransferase